MTEYLNGRYGRAVERVVSGMDLNVPAVRDFLANVLTRAAEGEAVAEGLRDVADAIVEHPDSGASGSRVLLIQNARAQASFWRNFDDTEDLVDTLVLAAIMLERDAPRE